MINKFNKKAIITGINGQDGYYLSKYLIDLNYEVIGIGNNNFNTIHKSVNIEKCDLNSKILIKELLKKFKPDEFYHLAAHHFSNENEIYNQNNKRFIEVNFLQTKNIIELILNYKKDCKFLFCGSSHMFSPKKNEKYTLISEKNNYEPKNYYGLTKAAGVNLVKYFRNFRKFLGYNVILFNHESPKRPKDFVSRKITDFAARTKLQIKKNLNSKKLKINNINSLVDWSHAKDIVIGMHLVLQKSHPSDFILASGKPHSVKELLQVSFDKVNLNWKDFVQFDKYCAEDKNCLVGSPAKVLKLGWTPKYNFNKMIEEMVEYDIEIYKSQI